jgi:hypothetical protein
MPAQNRPPLALEWSFWRAAKAKADQVRQAGLAAVKHDTNIATMADRSPTRPSATTKIATCSYCGTRTALVMSAQARHKLTCTACAAPLDNLRLWQPDPSPALPRPAPAPASDVGVAAVWNRRADTNDDDDDDEDRRTGSKGSNKKKSKKPKKDKKRRRKSLAERFLDEAKDALDDIFD